MQIIKNRTGSGLKVEGDLDISVAAELHQALREYCQEAFSLEVDLSGVGCCDVTALQLLYSLRKTAEEAAKPLTIAGFSDQLYKIAQAIGLEEGLSRRTATDSVDPSGGEVIAMDAPHVR